MCRWVSAARPLAWMLLLAAGCAPAAACAQAALTETDPDVVPILKQAETLLGEQKAAEAYGLLTRHELDLAGTPMFDYLLGLAALDSGHSSDATFALERAVANEPDFAGARVELARARFEQGDLELARAQFQYLLTQSPPPSTRAVIERYLGAINERSQLTGSHWSALAQFGAGYDSNANGSTSEQSFLGFTLDPRNVATSSSFGELMLGAGNTWALGSQSGLVSNVQVTHRANTDASFIDQSVISLDSSFIWAHEGTRYSVGVDSYRTWLDGRNHERGISLNVGASRRFGEYEAAASLRGGPLDYAPDGLQILDAERYLAGLSVARLNVGPKSARIGAALLVGKDEAKRAGSPYGNVRYGARLYASWPIQAESSLYFELSEMTADYDGTFFDAHRKDDTFSATLAFDLQSFPTANWNIAPRLRYTKSDSDVSLYAYDRVEAVVYIRRTF